MIFHYQRSVSIADDVHGAYAWRLSAVRSLEVVRISEVKMNAFNAAIGREVGGLSVVQRLYASIIRGSTVYARTGATCNALRDSCARKFHKIKKNGHVHAGHG